MININQFRELIIKPTLHDLMLYSKEAEELLVFTCANESCGGTYLHQIKGPALGIYQMEPLTYHDLWNNYINNNGKLMLILFSNFMVNHIPSEERMIYDLRFATVIARLFYARINDPLPFSGDIEGIWEYYKKYYNTFLGDAHKELAMKKYYEFIKS